MTTFTLGARADLKPPRVVTEQEYLQPVGNLLIDLAGVVDAHMAAISKRIRIVARIDDPTIEATQEQRAEAEARASALHYEGERHLKDFRRLAIAFVKEWGDLPGELQAFVKDEAFPMPCWDGVAAIAGADQTVMGMQVWRSLVGGRDERKERVA